MVRGSAEGAGGKVGRHTFGDDLPAEKRGKGDPEDAHTLGGHLPVIVQRLEQVGRVDYTLCQRRARGRAQGDGAYCSRARSTLWA